MGTLLLLALLLLAVCICTPFLMKMLSILIALGPVIIGILLFIGFLLI